MTVLWVLLPIISLITLIIVCVVVNKVSKMKKTIDELANNMRMREARSLFENNN